MSIYSNLSLGAIRPAKKKENGEGLSSLLFGHTRLEAAKCIWTAELGTHDLGHSKYKGHCPWAFVCFKTAFLPNKSTGMQKQIIASKLYRKDPQ